MHILCTICSDIVNQTESLYVTKCGHLFHHLCLSQWIERSRTCPQCRDAVTGASMWRVYPTAAPAPALEDAAALLARLDDAQLAAREQLAERRRADDAARRADDARAALQEQLEASERRAARWEAAAGALRDQLDAARAQSRDAARLRTDCQLLQGKLHTLQALQKVVEATAEEVETMLEGYSDARTIAVFATAFKRAVGAAERGRRGAEARLAAARAELAVTRARRDALHERCCQLQELAATEPRRVCKRKSSDSESTLPHKQSRLEPEVHSTDSTTETDAAASSANDVSLGTLVARIEAADSPYLTLQRAPPALAMQPKLEAKAQRASSRGGGGGAALSSSPADNKLSIFHKKPAVTLREHRALSAALHVAHDGLGGRCPPAPRPAQRPAPRPAQRPAPRPAPARSFAPRLTAKHRLAPTPTARDIGAIIQRMNTNKQ